MFYTAELVPSELKEQGFNIFISIATGTSSRFRLLGVESEIGGGVSGGNSAGSSKGGNGYSIGKPGAGGGGGSFTMNQIGAGGAGVNGGGSGIGLGTGGAGVSSSTPTTSNQQRWNGGSGTVFGGGLGGENPATTLLQIPLFALGGTGKGGDGYVDGVVRYGQGGGGGSYGNGGGGGAEDGGSRSKQDGGYGAGGAGATNQMHMQFTGGQGIAVLYYHS